MYQRIVVTYLYPLNIAINISIFRQPHISYHWLVVSTPMKNIGQLGLLFPIYGKIKNDPNHQPVSSWLYSNNILSTSPFPNYLAIVCNIYTWRQLKDHQRRWCRESSRSPMDSPAASLQCLAEGCHQWRCLRWWPPASVYSNWWCVQW